jgi:outer membrane protein OmpA-like peptidoglycan-associated protein
MFGGGIDGGATSTVSNERTEVDKKGLTYAGYIGTSMSPIDRSHLTLTLGIQGYAVKGTSGKRTQIVNARTALLAIDYRWSIWNIEPGLLIRGNHGKNASLRAEDKDTSMVSINLGPIVAYRWSLESSDMVGYLAVTRDMNVPKETNSSLILGFQYWLKNNDRPASPASAVEHSPTTSKSEAVASPQPRSEEVPHMNTSVVILRFKSETFKFQANSGELVTASMARASEIANIIAANTGSWESMEIGGHSDGASTNPARNLEVSELRAKAILQLFAKHGVPTESMSAKGYGASQPLAGVDPKAPENRRVEVKINNVKDVEKIKESLKEFLSEE